MEELYMPNLGMTMVEGKVLRWMVEDGAQVAEGDEVAEVASETGKLNMVVQAPCAGTVTQMAKVEEPVAIGAVFGTVG